MDNFECNDVYGIVDERNICTDGTNGKGVCSVSISINISYFVKSGSKKMRHDQLFAISKNPHFLSNPHETWRKY